MASSWVFNFSWRVFIITELCHITPTQVIYPLGRSSFLISFLFPCFYSRLFLVSQCKIRVYDDYIHNNSITSTTLYNQLCVCDNKQSPS